MGRVILGIPMESRSKTSATGSDHLNGVNIYHVNAPLDIDTVRTGRLIQSHFPAEQL